jgi:hypothetical protein
MVGFARRGLAQLAVGGLWVFYVVYVGTFVATIFRLQVVLR